VDAYTTKREQMSYRLDGMDWIALTDALSAFAGQIVDLPVYGPETFPFTRQSPLQFRRQCSAIPGPQLENRFAQAGDPFDRYALTSKEPPGSVVRRGLFVLQRIELWVQMPAVSLAHPGNSHASPGPPFSSVITDQHGEQFLSVHAIVLGTPFPARDLNAGRVNDQVLNTDRGQVAVYPEAVSAGFIATPNRCIFIQAESLLGTQDF